MVDSEKRSDFTFENDEVLLKGETCQKWQQIEDFYRFEYSTESKALLCVLDVGFKWWVVGFTEQPLTTIPEWKAKYK